MPIRRTVRRPLIPALIVCIAILAGCAKDSSPLSPATAGDASVESNALQNRGCWGWWRVSLNTDTLEFDVELLRSAAFTCNVTRFMQPPSSPVHMISFSIDPVGSDFPNGLFDVTVTLRHPFPGFNMYRGFDVRGIFMSDLGEFALDVDEHDPTLKYNRWDGPRLLNPDGYTRWWNYQEFTSYGTVFGYTPPAFAVPKNAEWFSMLNPYKYFADELGADDELSLDPANRGTFSATPGVNSRDYLIQFAKAGMSPVIQFTYAVDASWSQPDPAFAPDYPVEAFNLSANCQEAYQVKATIQSNSLWYEDAGNLGGDLGLKIEVFDWQSGSNPLGTPGEVSGIYLSSDIGGIDDLEIMSLASAEPGSGPTSSVWTVDLHDLSPYFPNDGLNRMLITIESLHPDTYGPDIANPDIFDYPSAPLAAYQWVYVPVGSEPAGPTIVVTYPNGGEILDVAEQVDVNWTAPPEVLDVKLEYSKDGFAGDVHEIIDSTGNDGSFLWEIPADPSETVRVRISEVGNPANFDISDGDFTIFGECEPDFTLKWSYDLPGNGYVDSSINGSITIADLEGDGMFESLVFTHNTYTLHCFDYEGNYKWPAFQCPTPVSSWYGAPAVGEFTGDGVLDIVVSNTDQNGPQPNRLYVIDGSDGAEVYNISSPDIFQCMPSLADVVGETPSDPPDGQLDIFVGRYDGGDQYNACYNGIDGSLVWQARRQSYSLATPALADMDNDSIIDCIAGGGYFDQPPSTAGICALRGEGIPADGRLIWEASYGSNILAPPSLCDYTGDDIPDVVVSDYAGASSTLRCLDGTTGATIWQYPINTWVCNPALGDLNSDGIPDIVVWPAYDHVIALNGDPSASNRVLWDWTDPETLNMDARSSAVLYDVTCDGVPDVFAPMRYLVPGGPNFGRLWIINGATGVEITYQDFPADQLGFGAPAVGDIDDDGYADVVIGTMDNSILYAYDLGTPVPIEYSARPWPQYLGNVRNTGLYGEE